MTPEEFKDLVKNMRTSQTEYFRTRSMAALNKSKMLERQVDAEINKTGNPELFS